MWSNPAILKRAPVIMALFMIFTSHSPAASGPRIAASINQALSSPCLAHSQEGVVIRSLDTGKTIFEKNGGLLFVPASNFKLVVGAAALDILGPDTHVSTSLYATVKPGDDGALQGDLVLVGAGDPVLTFEQLQHMAAKVKALGVKSIEGNVVGEDSCFDNMRLGEGWEWDSEAYYYAAQISGLNLNENYVDVFVRPEAVVGSPASVSLVPATDYMAIKNECTTSAAGSKSTIVVDRAAGGNIIRVTGAVPLDYRNPKPEESITVDDPTLFACHTLTNMLRQEGIEVQGSPIHGTLPKGSQLIDTVDSPQMSKMLSLLNKPSDNLIAECLLKFLGHEIKSQGTAEAGKAVELEWLKKIGADMSAIGITDGSGLARKNCVSPNNLVTILTYMHRGKNGKIFMHSLPVAGVDGTLKKRMKGTAAEGRVWGKTGSVEHVSCISGFVKTKAGENLVFSIMLNNYLCTKQEAMAVEDRILEKLAGTRTNL